MKKNVFIDGEYGTTGLKIRNILNSKNVAHFINLLSLDESEKKNKAKREAIYKKTDILILCLEDALAKEAVKTCKAVNSACRILDASSAHRTNINWVYGFSEMKGQAEKIKKAKYLSNPGCYAMAFVSVMRPLVEAKASLQTIPVTAYGISGYSGGGRKLIDSYENKIPGKSMPAPFAPYALSMDHKHVAEMQKYSLLSEPPLFMPAVSTSYRGMLVCLSFHKAVLKQNKLQASDILSILRPYYNKSDDIQVRLLEEEKLIDGKFLDFTKNNNSGKLDIIVCAGLTGHVSIWARLDNLGIGASINAVKNLRLMLMLHP